MIDTVLRTITRELEQFVRLRTVGGDNLVVLSAPFDITGATPPEAADKLLVFLVHIDREGIPIRAVRQVDRAKDRVGLMQPPVHLNLLFMLAANFGGANYPEGMKLLSLAVAFFQSRPVLTNINTPELDPRIDQLSVEIESLNLADSRHLWSTIGGRYLPSLLYRIRVITIDAERLERQAPRIERSLMGVQPSGAS